MALFFFFILLVVFLLPSRSGGLRPPQQAMRLRLLVFDLVLRRPETSATERLEALELQA